MVAGINRDKEK
ncbi:hypothetical protein TYRP_000225 [Tyrophagus putrescentiae]|nr:hypothetical protein TYRP_000225 [Tyrophagus putrescentiae]